MKLSFTEADQPREFTVPTGPALTVGRQKECGLSIKDLSISKEHCQLQLSAAGDKLLIRDLGSRNGTWINGHKVGDQFVECAATDDLIIGKVPIQLASDAGGMAPMSMGDEEEEGTMFDPDFSSAAAWGQPAAPAAPPVAPAPTPAAQMPAAAAPAPAPAPMAPSVPAAGGPQLSGQVVQPGLPSTPFSLHPGSHMVGTDATCSIQVSASGVSGMHSKLEFSGGKWFVEDLGSRNGTYINKQPVTRQEINPGDAIFVGPVKLDVAGAAAAGAPAPGLEAAAAPTADAPAKKSPLLLIVIIVLLLGGGGLGAMVMMKPKGGGGSGGASGGKKGPNMGAFKEAVKESVKMMGTKDYESALNLLTTAKQMVDSKVIKDLIELANLLEKDPTKHITEIAELSKRLMELSNPTWRETGVVAFATTLNAQWSAEQDNAILAAEGDKLFTKQNWEAALEKYRQIKKESEFRQARSPKMATCRKRIAGELLELAKKALEEDQPEQAAIHIDKCLKYAPPEMTTEVYQIKERISKNRRYGKLLREGRALMQNDELEAAQEKLRLIPDSSEYYDKASRLLEEIDNKITGISARKLYKGGKGDQALALLKGAQPKQLRDLATEIRKVVEQYRLAVRKYNAEEYVQANEHWNIIKDLITDQENFYYKEAIEKVRTDPKVEAAVLAAKAAKLVNSIKREDKILAALYAAKALQFDKENQIALKMRKDFEREINLKYLLADQRFRDSGDAKAFLAEASHWYRLKIAIRPAGDKLLAKIGKRIQEAGGKVPERDKIPATEE